MRILLSLFIGAVSFFYLSELIIQITAKTPFFKNVLPLRRNLVGLILFITGIALGIFESFDPMKVLVSAFMIGAGAGLIIHHFLSESYLFFKESEQGFARTHEQGINRFIEILPGAFTWITLTSPIWLSFIFPFAVAYLILVANVYWFLNAVKIAVLIYIGYKKLKYVQSQNWLARLKKDYSGTLDKYYHLLIVPTYKEGLEVLKPAFDAIARSNYPKDKIFLAVGFEAWDSQEKIQTTTSYLQTLSKKIGGVFTTIHQLQPGEIRGPATNRNCIARNALNQFKKLNILPENVFVTTLDADFVLHKDFLAGALYKYLSTPKRIRDKRTYTGSFLYYNNYWQTPAPMRLVAIGTQFWQLAEMVGSDKYMNFSSLSINFKSLLDIGLWIPDKVNDDSGFFWKAYFYFKGDYKVIPHFLPIYADAVLDVNLPKTFINQYLQLKRWAYGVEHIPYVVSEYFKHKDMDFLAKTDMLLFALWGYLRWGTLALLITFGGMLIPLINPYYAQSVVSYNLPVISSWILTAAFISLFSTIYVHEKTVPQRPQGWTAIKKVFSYIQWVLIPIILVTISTLPAIDAQTSLMLGRYLEFRVTNKVRL